MFWDLDLAKAEGKTHPNVWILLLFLIVLEPTRELDKLTFSDRIKSSPARVVAASRDPPTKQTHPYNKASC